MAIRIRKDGGSTSRYWGLLIEIPGGFAGVPASWERIPNDRQNKTAPENANYYFDPVSGYHFLFTNQFNQQYNATDCNVALDERRRSLGRPQQCRSRGCKVHQRRMGDRSDRNPSVLRVDDETLLLVYDAIKGNSIGHTPGTSDTDIGKYRSSTKRANRFPQY